MGNPITQIESNEAPKNPQRRGFLSLSAAGVLGFLAGNALGTERVIASNSLDTNPGQFRNIELTNVAQLERLFQEAIKRMDKISSMLGGGGEDRLVLFEYLRGCGCLVSPDILGNPIKIDDTHVKYRILGVYGETGNVEYTVGEGQWELFQVLPDIIQKIKNRTYNTTIAVLNDPRNQELLLKTVDAGAKAELSDLLRKDDTHAYFLAPWCKIPDIATATTTAPATLTPTPTSTPATPTNTPELPKTNTPDAPKSSPTPAPQPTSEIRTSTPAPTSTPRLENTPTQLAPTATKDIVPPTAAPQPTKAR
jgi:hypothetical protein